MTFTAASAALVAGRRASVPPRLPQVFHRSAHFLSKQLLSSLRLSAFRSALAAAILLANGPAAVGQQQDIGDSLRKAIAEGAREVELPAGIHELTREIVIPETASRIEITGAKAGTTLRLARGFSGRAAIVIEGARGISLADLAIDGNRAELANPAGGVVADNARDLSLFKISFREMPAFAVRIARSQRISMQWLKVENSGTEGILIEGGSTGFRLSDSEFLRISGNGIRICSNGAPRRNGDGTIERNHFEEIGRDAIRVEDATRIVVANNNGRRIGYPSGAVDTKDGGVAAGIGTAGNVDRSTYAGNRFEELNGWCINLDGFHHGEVVGNSCVNRGKASDYPNGRYAIAFNNTNDAVKSRSVRVSANVVYGAKFGGIFAIGEDHIITDNQLMRINQAGCPESRDRFGCLEFKDEPDRLSAGIYLSRGAAHPEPARRILVRDNVVTGGGMALRCIKAAPGVSLKDNAIEENQCIDETAEGGGGNQ
jgi:hypothetical protein